MKYTFILLFALLFVACGEKKAEESKDENKAPDTEEQTDENADAENPSDAEVEAAWLKDRINEAAALYKKHMDLNCKCYYESEGDMDVQDACMEKGNAKKIWAEFQTLEEEIGKDNEDLHKKLDPIDEEAKNCEL